ncbi:MAG: NFACT family protein, partial [Polyangiaceae bacterium]
MLLAEHAALLREVARAIVRLDKRVKAVNLDLAKIDEAESLASLAPWIVPAAAKARRGAKSLAFSDWSTGEEKKIELPLDPSKSAKEQVDAMFARARRLRAGRPIAEKRRDEAKAIAEKLHALTGELSALAFDSPDLEAQIEDIHERAKKIAPKEIRGDAKAPVAKRKLQERAPPFRTFVGRGDTKILVGRGADRNDELTFDVARPHHAWLHAKGEA